MKRRRIRLRWLVPLAVLLLPPLFWALVLSVVPTDWARQRIVARMSAATGRTVRIATVRVGILGGIYLTGLEIGAPGAAGDPWLKVAEAHLNVTPLQFFYGQVAPTETEVRGITLRVLRRQNGTLELDDLIQGAAPASPTGSAPSTCPLSRLSLRIRDARVTVIDEPTRTRFEFREVEGRATSVERHATIQELRGTLNGGPVELVAQLDRSTPAPFFEGHLRARGVGLNGKLTALGYLVPVLAGDAASLEGTLDLDLYVRGRGTSRGELRRTLVGHGAVNLDPVQLDGSRVLDELSSLIELPEQARVGAIKGDFAIKQGRVASNNLTVDVARVPIVLAGWTDFDGRVNYRMRTDDLIERLPGKARDLLAELSIDTRELATLKIEGPLDAATVTVDGTPLSQASGRGEAVPTPGDDRQRLRALGRRLRDRILR